MVELEHVGIGLCTVGAGMGGEEAATEPTCRIDPPPARGSALQHVPLASGSEVLSKAGTTPVLSALRVAAELLEREKPPTAPAAL